METKTDKYNKPPKYKRAVCPKCAKIHIIPYIATLFSCGTCGWERSEDVAKN